MTNDRPEEHPNPMDGAGEDADFQQPNAGKAPFSATLLLSWFFLISLCFYATCRRPGTTN